METKRVSTDRIRLFRVAEATAKALAQQHEGLRIDEALLRAAIAWAKFARESHIAAVERATDSAKARAFVKPARERRIRAEWRLRLRLAEVITRKSQFVNDERLSKLAKLALSLVA